MRFQPSNEYLGGLAAATARNNRVEVAVDSTKWIIERRPEHYPLIPGTQLRCATFRPLSDLPELRLFFQVITEPDGSLSCSLIALRFDDPVEEDDEDISDP